MKVNKPIAVIIGLVTICVLLYYLLIIKSYYRPFNIPTSANEPGLNIGKTVFATSLKEYAKNDFIIYKRFDSIMLQKEAYFVFRLIAEELDTIQIIDGVTFVNHKNVDRGLTLKHLSLVAKADLKTLTAAEKGYEYYSVSNDHYLAHLADDVIKEKGFSIKVYDTTFRDLSVEKIYGQNWNTDNFGPYVLPKGKLFVMGDNRHNALDSRFIGPIDREKVIAVILK